jgi:hypothetical protein
LEIRKTLFAGHGKPKRFNLEKKTRIIEQFKNLKKKINTDTIIM